MKAVHKRLGELVNKGLTEEKDVLFRVLLRFTERRRRPPAHSEITNEEVLALFHNNVDLPRL